MKMKKPGRKYRFLLVLLLPALVILWIGLRDSRSPGEDMETEQAETGQAQDPLEENKDPGNLLRFDFGEGDPIAGYRKATPEDRFSGGKSFGFLSGEPLEAGQMEAYRDGDSDYLGSPGVFLFLAGVPEGNYDVKITVAGTGSHPRLTLKAESRRLMARDLEIKNGEVRTFEFTTNVRFPETPSGKRVRLKPREIGHLNWDRQLSVEFGGQDFGIASLEISPNQGAVTVFLAGNSTVTDQRSEPYSAWGQMLPAFFKPRLVSVANHAESGEALKSFLAENRLEKLLSQVRPDDYVFIQFAHNDQKPQSSAYAAPFTDYQYYLKQYISEIRNLGAVPVLVTPMLRRVFNQEGKVINTHGDYPEAMRQVAREEEVVLLDLFEMSRVLYEALGEEGSKKFFVHFPAGTFPGQEEALKDDSHHSTYGAWQLAKCVVKGIRQSHMELAFNLRDGLPEYDPAHPDPFNAWDLPLSPDIDLITPEGR